ncbi:adenylate/guanylate cyclase domain-containing protein [Candidatus Pelagibacter sp.]|nr:adenylate/guanylate cyclase domain-containing protein [Candidatus Pelagibacter sp.]
MNKFTSTWAVVVSVVILLGLKVYNPLPLQTLELKTFDLYQKFGNHYESKSLVMLDISDKALTKEGQWPWKRDKLGRAIVNAYRNGAALVFLNVVFVHKDRLGGDEKFLKMIAKYPIILTETSQAKNLISIKRKALAVGNVEVPIDVDGTIRKLPLDKSVPSVILNIIKFPIPNQENIWIDFRHDIPRIDYADKDWSSMKGKIVLIGTTFQGSTFVLTPNGLKNTHEIMALSTETLLSGKFITRPEWALYVEFAVMIIGMALFILLIPRLGILMSLVPFILYNTFIILSSFYLFNKYLCLTNWSYPVIIGFIVFSHLIYNNFIRENRLKLQIKKQFEHYLSPDMVKKLQDNPSLLKLGGETRELTFLFCDIRGFTPISEKYKKDPQGLTRLINSFLTPMTDIILKSGGTIDKYMGDCIMAFWNAPLDCADHQKKAILVAKDMREKMKKLDLGFNIGIGINSGTAVVGNMGSDQRFDYSVLGDAVNLASRLEGQSKDFNTTIVIGEDTYKDAKELHKRMYKLGSVTVKGKSNKVKIYSIK